MVRFELTTYCLGGSRSGSAELHHLFTNLLSQFCDSVLMVGRGLEPRPFGLQPSALPVVLTNQNLMFVEGFEPSASGFVDQRSLSSAELHEQSLGNRIRTCVGLLPRQVGNRYPTPRKSDGTGGTRTHNFQFAGLVPFQFGYDPRLLRRYKKIGTAGLEPTTAGL